jgi:hypothetical protein
LNTHDHNRDRKAELVAAKLAPRELGDLPGGVHSPLSDTKLLTDEDPREDWRRTATGKTSHRSQRSKNYELLDRTHARRVPEGL